MGDGWLVTAPAAPPASYGKQFWEQFPFYLSIGMTERQYWDEDCELVRAFRKADRLRLERKNQELWLQGMYFYEALGDVSPLLHAFAKKGTKAMPYRAEPYPLDGLSPQENEREVENERLKAALYFKNWARANRNIGK